MANAVETLEKLERRLTITISLAEVQAEVEKQLKIRARTAKAPGFRAGKVPLKMVSAQYGAQIQNEVLNDKVGSAFEVTAKENDLRVAGYPRFEPKEDGDVAADALAFTATFEVYPEIKVGELDNVEIEKIDTQVTDAELNKTLDVLRKRQAHYHPKGEQGDHGDGGADTSAQDGDRVTIDFVGRIDGEEFDGGKAEGYAFVLGEGRMLPEFENAIRGMKAGEVKVFPLTFPGDYQGQDVAGKTAEFTVTVKQVEWAHLPEVNSDLAKMFGIADGDVDKMMKEIENNLVKEVKNRLANANKNKVMDALLTATEFDVPKNLINQEIAQLMEMTRSDMASRNMNPEGFNLPPELFTAQAEKRVKLGLIVGTLIKDNALEVTTEEMRKKADEIASSYENPEAVSGYYMNDAQRRQELEAVVMEEKVIDYVFSKVKVVEKTVPFEELMSQQA